MEMFDVYPLPPEPQIKNTVKHKMPKLGFKNQKILSYSWKFHVLDYLCVSIPRIHFVQDIGLFCSICWMAFSLDI